MFLTYQRILAVKLPLRYLFFMDYAGWESGSLYVNINILSSLCASFFQARLLLELPHCMGFCHMQPSQLTEVLRKGHSHGCWCSLL